MENRAYWEDIIPNDERISPGRTITEADVTNFAGLSGSWDPEHVDKEFARNSPFQERIAHGLLTLAVAEGLRARMVWYNGDNLRSDTFIAFLGMNNLKYKQAVKFGDTIRCKTRVIQKRETKKLDRGIVTFQDQVVNQRNEVVAEWERVAMFRRCNSNGGADSDGAHKCVVSRRKNS